MNSSQKIPVFKIVELTIKSFGVYSCSDSDSIFGPDHVSNYSLVNFQIFQIRNFGPDLSKQDSGQNWNWETYPTHEIDFMDQNCTGPKTFLDQNVDPESTTWFWSSVIEPSMTTT